MSLVQTPITAIASNYQGLYVTVTNPLLPSSIFDNFSSANQLSFLPGLFSSTWCNLNFGSTIYVSTLISPYAVIVGPDNTVGGIYTLTAGISNSNFGSNAFVGGCNSYGADANIIAYGTDVGAISTNAAAFGSGTWATGQNSVAFGHSSMTFIGSNQHAHGELSIADGTASHAEGWSTIVYSDFSHVEGGDTQIWSGVASHAEGIDTWISSLGVSHVEGLSTFVYGGEGSHAEGAFTVADVGVAHAEGERTIALGSSVHTQGFLNLTSTALGSVGGGPLLPLGPLNTHVEGMCNLAFAPNNHVQGVSSINSSNGWVSHIDGIGNINRGTICRVHGFSNIMDGNLFLNNSTFERSISSIFTGFNVVTTSNNIFNHVEGVRNTLNTNMSFCSHVEGIAHILGSDNYMHIEGSNIIYDRPRAIFTNLIIGAYAHIEGNGHTFGANCPPPGGHFEGIGNTWAQNNGANAGSLHLEGIGNNGGTAYENKSLHAEGSNILAISIINFGAAVNNTSTHKEGVNNYVAGFSQNTSITGERNSGVAYGFIGGYCNAGALSNMAPAVFGQFNNINQYGSVTCIGLSNNNCNIPSSNHCGISLVNYTSNINNGALAYGGAAFFHSTTNSKLIQGSAQSYMLNLRAITSTTALVFSNFLFMGASANNVTFSGSNVVSTIAYISGCNTQLSYPASNQVTYMHAVDLKITGYQQRRGNSSAGLGFYSGNFSFGIYRDNTQTSNLCIFDMVSQSTVTTGIISTIITPIQPASQVNRLFNTTQINLQVYARNISTLIPQSAHYGLRINTNNNILTNWMAQCEISQVMRP